MAWAKNGTPHTLTTSGDVLEITDLTAQKFNQGLYHTIATGNINPRIRFNDDSGTKYAQRENVNGGSGTDVTGVSATQFDTDAGESATDRFTVFYFVSISGEEKLMIAFGMDHIAAGAANAPGRKEVVGKYVPSPDADITEVNCPNTGAGSFDTNTNLSALGTD